jgi:hypothetical protein
MQMRISTCAISIALLSAVSSTALGQPGQPTPPPPPAGYGQTWGAPTPQLTYEERKLLEKGEYSDGQIVGGGLLGTFFGFGLGHAVQGRFREKGWIFLAGEAVGGYFWMWSLFQCVTESIDGDDDCNESMLVGSMVLVAVVRIWEIVDVWAYPARHNRRYRRLRNRLYQQQGPYRQQSTWGWYAAPGKDGGGVAGVVVRF